MGRGRSMGGRGVGARRSSPIASVLSFLKIVARSITGCGGNGGAGGY